MTTGVVIQGPITDILCLKKNIEYLKEWFDTKDIVVSTWDNKSAAKLELLDIEIILNNEQAVSGSCEHFNVLNHNNFFYQIWSSAQGVAQLLKKKNYDHIIKIRTDEYYKNYDSLIRSMEDDSRIHSSSIFFRSDVPFHVGDHLLAGPAMKIKELFESNLRKLIDLTDFDRFCYECNVNFYSTALFRDPDFSIGKLHPFTPNMIPPECKLAVEYLRSRGIDNISPGSSATLMKEYFKPVDVNWFEEYLCRANSLGFDITQDTYSNAIDTILYSPHYSCSNCHPNIICDTRIRQSILVILLRNMATTADHIKNYKHDDFTTYCSIHAPFKLLPEFNKRIRI